MKKSWLQGLTLALVIVGTVFLFRVGVGISSEKARLQDDASVEGSVVSLDQSSPIPVLDLKTADDKIVKINIDSETTVLQDNQVGSLGQLAPGQRVKVHYGTKNGKQVTTSVVIISPLLSFPPANEQPHPLGE
ncbi:MAG: hypothetical protein Q7J69_04785 [Candidatus Omnitrophota bacterium]|nr:hypothetical protein [Candidatus Omnitrophota bacterium]